MERLVRKGPALVGASVVLCAAGPALADDSAPTRQAEAIHGEFLANLPAPSAGAKAVCIVDTGVDITADLEDSVVHRDALDGGSVGDLSSNHHGTKVAQVLAGKAGNGWGSSGIWPAVKVISIRASSAADPGTYDWREYIDGIERCFNRARDLGFSLAAVNLSLGDLSASSGELDAVREAVEQAVQLQGVSIVAAAGNSAAEEVSYPARFEKSFAVGAASSSNSELCEFSNRGSGLDILAAGCELDVADEAGRLDGDQGTSFAAPAVSAVIAALRSYDDVLTTEGAENLLLDTADRTSRGKVLNVENAFRAAGLGMYVDKYGVGSDATPESETASDGSEAVSIGPFDGIYAVPTGSISVHNSQNSSGLTVVSKSVSAPRILSAEIVGKRAILRLAGWRNGAILVLKVGSKTYVFKKKKLRLKIPLTSRFVALKACWVLPGGDRSKWTILRKREMKSNRTRGTRSAERIEL